MGVTYIYQYWHGPRPEYIQRLESTVQSIYGNRPGYQYFQITDNILPDFLSELYNTNARVEQVSDIIRYYYVWKTGGVWLDSDIAFRRYIDFRQLLEEQPGRVVTTNVRYPQFVEASNGVLACNKGNLLIKQMYDMGRSILKNYSGKKVSYIFVGPALATAILKSNENWYCLPNRGYKHQIVKWGDYTRHKKLDLVQKDDNWYFAHFTGYNAMKWAKGGYNPHSVIEQTVRRCE